MNKAFVTIVAGLLASAAVGCSSSSDHATGSASAAPASSSGKATGDAWCEKARALRERFAAIDVKVTRIHTNAHLPTAGEGTAPSGEWAVLDDEHDDPKMNGSLLRSEEDLASRLSDRRRDALLLAIDAHAKVELLLPLIEGVASSTTIYIAASPKDAKREAPPASFAKQADNPDPSDRARAFARAISDATGSCKPAASVFQHLASPGIDAAAKTQSVVNDLPAAVNACDCAVGDDFVPMMAYLLGGDTPIVAKKLVLSREASAKKIPLSGLDGQKLYDSLPADGAPVTFVR